MKSSEFIKQSENIFIARRKDDHQLLLLVQLHDKRNIFAFIQILIVLYLLRLFLILTILQSMKV